MNTHEDDHKRTMRKLDMAFAAIVFSLGLWLGTEISSVLIERSWKQAYVEGRIGVTTNSTLSVEIVKR